MAMRCPECGDNLDENNYCFECGKFFDDDELSDDFEDDFTNDFDDSDYDSLVDNGDEICLNCTFWSVSPYGSAYGMVCRKGQFSDGPGDSCELFVAETHFASYGDGGQYQFNETGQAISNKLYHWKNNR
jgi:hypothetical protein